MPTLGRSVLFAILAALIGLSQTAAAEDQPLVSLLVGNLHADEGGLADTEESPLKMPFGIDFDSAGNMIIVELEGGRVHRRSPDGKLEQISGDGSKSYQGDGGPAARATFNGMHNVAIAPDDSIYISDTWNHAIRRIDPKSGVITTLAGNGKAGFAGDGGPARDAQFNFVMCVALNPAGNKLYVADLKNYRIRLVDLESGKVSTVAGNGRRGVPQDGAQAIDSPLVDPRAVAVDAAENFYILERGGHALRVVSPDGIIRTVAGTGKKGNQDGPALKAQLNAPKHICVDQHNCVYIADDGNHTIRKYDPAGQTVSTVLGAGQGTPAVRLKRPHGVCVERDKLFVVDSYHDRIFRIE